MRIDRTSTHEKNLTTPHDRTHRNVFTPINANLATPFFRHVDDIAHDTGHKYRYLMISDDMWMYTYTVGWDSGLSQYIGNPLGNPSKTTKLVISAVRLKFHPQVVNNCGYACVVSIHKLKTYPTDGS